MRQVILILAGLLFAFGGGIHLYRLFVPFKIQIGSYHVSRWSSLFFVFLGFFLAYLLLDLAFFSKECI